MLLLPSTLTYEAPKLAEIEPKSQVSTLYQKEDINAVIGKLSAKYDIPEHLIHSIVKCESQYDPEARNYEAVVGVDIGIAQINSHFHQARMEELGLDIYNHVDNLEYGVLLMSEDLTHYKWSKHCWGDVLVNL